MMILAAALTAFPIRGQREAAIFDYIETFCNRTRRHRSWVTSAPKPFEVDIT